MGGVSRHPDITGRRALPLKTLVDRSLQSNTPMSLQYEPWVEGLRMAGWHESRQFPGRCFKSTGPTPDDDGLERRSPGQSHWTRDVKQANVASCRLQEAVEAF